MFQLSSQRGFTLVELMVGLAIMGLLLFVGIPSMTHWSVTNKAKSASEFYAEGLSMARRQAVMSNARSRLILTPNPNNGQLDWQVDICFPTALVPCNNASGTWSTTATAAPGDPQGAAGFKSIFRSADRVVPATVMVPSLQPAGASTVYFTEVGWVDTTVPQRLSRIELDPVATYNHEVPAVALVITLAGMASKCDPTKAAPDSRACPP